METFAGLHGALGKPEAGVEPPATFLKTKKATAHPDLEALWTEEGWARYAGGEFWVVDPRPFDELLSEWSTVPKDAIVFARNAFGDLFLFSDGVVVALTIQTGQMNKASRTVELFLNDTLAQPAIRGSLLETALFKKVRKRLGDLEAEECYGLFPPASLGGDPEDVGAYRKAKLREYFSLVAESHG